MLEGGEDLRFIARRLIILASEDIGNANPNALLLATSTFQAVDVVGMPEARIILAQCVTYLACSEKSNASYKGINAAIEEVRNRPELPVPLHLRNAPTGLMKNLGYGEGYKYTHDHDTQAGLQQYLPAALGRTAYYKPKPVGSEKKLRQWVEERWPERVAPPTEPQKPRS
jgi:putative ATPase